MNIQMHLSGVVFSEGKNNMWMEIKALFTVVAVIFICIVLSQIIFASTLMGFLLIAGLVCIIISDILIGMKINDYKSLYDPTPRGWELMELQQIDGKVVWMNTKKGPHGKRSFRINGEDASVINNGKGSFITPNGNRGFRAHENFDMNVEPNRAKALEQMPGDDVKETYYLAKQFVDKIPTCEVVKG